MPPRVRPAPLRLGVGHFAVVASGLLSVVAVFWVVNPYQWQERYYGEVVLPRMQASHGFAWGKVTFSCASLPLGITFDGIVSVVPGARASRMGLRAGDVPWTFHGYGNGALVVAMENADLRRPFDVDVLNSDDCRSGREKRGFRTVARAPRL